jgi:hypothetical protein
VSEGRGRLDIDASSLIAGLFVSSVGFVLFSYGKKMSRPPQMVGGLVLMVFPYFVPGVLWMLAIGAVLCALIWVAVQRGY